MQGKSSKIGILIQNNFNPFKIILVTINVYGWIFDAWRISEYCGGEFSTNFWTFPWTGSSRLVRLKYNQIKIVELFSLLRRNAQKLSQQKQNFDRAMITEAKRQGWTETVTWIKWVCPCLDDLQFSADLKLFWRCACASSCNCRRAPGPTSIFHSHKSSALNKLNRTTN